MRLASLCLLAPLWLLTTGARPSDDDIRTDGADTPVIRMTAMCFGQWNPDVSIFAGVKFHIIWYSRDERSDAEFDSMNRGPCARY